MDQWRYRRQVIWDKRMRMYYGVLWDVENAREVHRTLRAKTRQEINSVLDSQIRLLTDSGAL